MLTNEQFNNKWKEIKGGIRAIWGKITDEEVEEYKGDITEMSGLIEERYGETKQNIQKELDQLMDSFNNESDKNIIFDQSSYQRSPTRERTSEESQIEDASEDYFTRSPERGAFDKKTSEEHLNKET